MSYPSYLIHFNKNHSSSTGQFISGDGDGDGVIDDHHNYKKNKLVSKFSGENARENLRKAGTYKVHKMVDKELKKGDKLDRYGRAKRSIERIESDYKKAEEIGTQKFNKLKQKDKTLDKYDLEDFIDEAYDRIHDYKQDTIDRLLDAGFDNDGAEYVAGYLHNPW